jgi:hypothetical protein
MTPHPVTALTALCVRCVVHVCRASDSAGRSAFRPFNLTMQKDGNLVGELTRSRQSLLSLALGSCRDHFWLSNSTQPNLLRAQLRQLLSSLCYLPAHVTPTVSPPSPLPPHAHTHTVVSAAASDNLRQAVWMSSTAGQGSGPYRLTVQDNGNVAVYDGTSSLLWATHTGQRGPEEALSAMLPRALGVGPGGRAP